REIASKWGESQVLSGPIIGVPYTVMRQVSAVDENGRNKTEAYLDKDYIFLAAKNTSFVSKVSPTYLKRGIYRTVVYQATAQIQGHFDEIDFSKLEIENVELHWEKAKMFIRSEEHTSELQSRENLVCRLLLEKKNDSEVYKY